MKIQGGVAESRSMPCVRMMLARIKFALMTLDQHGQDLISVRGPMGISAEHLIKPFMLHLITFRKSWLLVSDGTRVKCAITISMSRVKRCSTKQQS